eukprot:GEMP01048484.1.p1 GENE.GEMP01048484.1~~GEMP01048484.1.p1  ORF type:complete len:179 (+),score=40.63 GEMP01048484.1:162-698(+)
MTESQTFTAARMTPPPQSRATMNQYGTVVAPGGPEVSRATIAPTYQPPTTTAQIPPQSTALPQQFAAAITPNMVQRLSQQNQMPMQTQMQGTVMQQSGQQPAMQYASMQQSGGQWIPGVARPQLQNVANPPVQTNNISYGPSYSMNYSKRSNADKSAVKYTGFLPLEGFHEEDTCRIG